MKKARKWAQLKQRNKDEQKKQKKKNDDMTPAEKGRTSNRKKTKEEGDGG